MSTYFDSSVKLKVIPSNKMGMIPMVREMQ